MGGIFIFIRWLLLATTVWDSSGYENIIFLGADNGSFFKVVPKVLFFLEEKNFPMCSSNKIETAFSGYHPMNLKMIEDFEIVSP